MYSPLPGPKWIRLLDVLPGHRGNHIRATIKVVNLEDCPAYEALSYVWGNPQPAVKILCDEQYIDVTPNLGAALQRVRHEHSTPQTLWIDAICINQLDIEERSQQVLLMRDIYRKAEGVLVWLGEDDGSARIAIPIIQKLAGYAREESGIYTPKMHQLSQDSPYSALELRKDLPPLDHQDWRAVHSFYKREWFSRIWVLQEVARDDIAIMVIGMHTLAWLDVATASLWLTSKHMYTSFEEGMILSRASVIHTTRSRIGLLGTLRITTPLFKATDPRDKVYAMLGLSFENQELQPNSLLAPNYRKTLVQVYGDVVRHFISMPNTHRFEGPWASMGEGVLDILGNWTVPHVKLKDVKVESTDDFPTWVPRWDLNGVGAMGLTSNARAFRWAASLDSAVITLATDSSRSLSLKGLRIATIKASNYALETNWRLINATDEDKRTWVKEMLEKTIEAVPNCTGIGTLKEAFASTITALGTKNDLVNLDSIPEACHEADLDSFLLHGVQSEDGQRFFQAISFTQTFFITNKGHLGLGHPNLKTGDQVCVLFGGKPLYIIRRVGAHFEFVGECFVHGYMNGEAMDLWKYGRLRDEWIELR